MSGLPGRIAAGTTVRLAHTVRVLHAVSGEPVEPLSARLDRPRPGWSVRTRANTVAVAVRDGAPAPSGPPVLSIAVADPVLAAALATPAMTVPLTGAELELRLAPVPMTLSVELLATEDHTATGRTMVASAKSGPSPRPTVALPETVPGVYVSAPVVWTAAFRPLELLVDGASLGEITIDVTRGSPRVRLVATA
ncbi:hypothetical protein KV205_25760 [Streptomyces sp. SKN60]|uniref:hypothetical protein n=1 Tax=Streptomyces sp. SKN60 TaxID=2855506 RepID=UPI0022457755|nr:hypothetical protein [Streptomyces sp. SKN60]MCX2183912.1 hypothetical protein [Streptomyces sp. SKN60]